MVIRSLTCILLGPVLVLLCLGHGFGEEWPHFPYGRQEQIRSQVNYDLKLSDPFFETENWSCRNNEEECDKKDRLKNTARCLTSFKYDHWISFCDAKLLDIDTVELFIHESTSSTYDNLRIVVQNGAFRSQYWTSYEGPDEDLIWTTKRQELTLDKNAYGKGDVIKGRIVFECVEAAKDPGARYNRTVKIEGVFKTILK
jgi:hypothetical protein